MNLIIVSKKYELSNTEAVLKEMYRLFLFCYGLFQGLVFFCWGWVFLFSGVVIIWKQLFVQHALLHLLLLHVDDVDVALEVQNVESVARENDFV